MSRFLPFAVLLATLSAGACARRRTPSAEPTPTNETSVNIRTLEGTIETAEASSFPLSAMIGDAATGEIVRETATELHLNVRPCKEPKIVVFRKPYAKESAGTSTCGQDQKSLYAVTQEGEFLLSPQRRD